MEKLIRSLHHVTATVDGAQEDLDFCRRTLGLRLVKRTVNFDNHGVYHFYYGDERGSPSTLWTTFPYRGRGVAAGSRGAGQVVTTRFSVPAGALAFWKARVEASGRAIEAGTTAFGEASLALRDPSGLAIELVASERDARRPWTAGDIGAAEAIRGLHGAVLLVRDAAPTLELVTGLLGLEVAAEAGGRVRLAAGADRPGHWLEVAVDPAAPPARNGLGTVHHVALAIATAEQQLALRQELLSRGSTVTAVMDRHYFRSIYFREPGGVLLEVATLGPGFTVDEEPARLGQGLMLPPWVEPERPAIEAALSRVTES